MGGNIAGFLISLNEACMQNWGRLAAGPARCLGMGRWVFRRRAVLRGSLVACFAVVFAVTARLASSRGSGWLRLESVTDGPKRGSLPVRSLLALAADERSPQVTRVAFGDGGVSWSQRIQLSSLQSEADRGRCRWTIAV